MPSAIAAGGVKDQFPSPSAVVVPSTVFPSKILTLEPACAVPESVGRASFVTSFSAIGPTPGVTSSVTDVIAGAAGGGVEPSPFSTMTLSSSDMLPASSLAVAETTVSSISGASGV